MNAVIVLFPLIGMEFNGLSVRFGQSRAEVEKMLGEPESVHNSRCYYFAGELALDFDGDGGLQFIEFLGGADSALRPDLYGQDVFAADADELLALLAERNGPDIDDGEAEYGYALRKLSVGLYREITPADVKNMLLEMSSIKLDRLSGVDVDEEMKKAHHWAAIGIGRKNYYA